MTPLGQIGVTSQLGDRFLFTFPLGDDDAGEVLRFVLRFVGDYTGVAARLVSRRLL